MASTFKFLDRKSSEDETSVNDRAQLIMQLAQQQMRQQRNNQRAFALLLEKAAPSQRTTGGTDAMGKDKKAVQEPVKAKREQGQWDLDVIQEFVINDMQWGQPSNRQKKQMGRKVKAMELSIEDLILPPVPANDSSETYAELLETQELGLLRDDRAKDIEAQLGKDGIVAAFKKYSDENGLQTNWDFVRMVLDDVQTICLNLKFAHNRVRPSTLAQHLEIVLSPHGDHHSPSYPSFHSTAGRVLAEVISGAYAGHREKLMRIGDTIGMNRVIGGYHFLTDHQVGQSLGSQLVLKIPQNLSINPVYETERTVDGRTAEAVAANFMDALEQRHRTMAVNKEENAEDNYVEGIRAAMATHARETSHMTDILKTYTGVEGETPDERATGGEAKEENPRTITINSGGAEGADSAWEAAITDPSTQKLVGHAFEGQSYYSNYSNRRLHPNETIEENQEKYEEAFEWLKSHGTKSRLITTEGKTDPEDISRAEYSLKLQGRNYEQVRNSDAVLAVVEKFQGRAPAGGTGVAVAMGILENKPVHVYDLANDSWVTYSSETDSWSVTGRPPFYQNFAGVGTRKATKGTKGWNVIHDYMSEMSDFQKTDTPFGADTGVEGPPLRPSRRVVAETAAERSAPSLLGDRYNSERENMQGFARGTEAPVKRKDFSGKMGGSYRSPEESEVETGVQERPLIGQEPENTEPLVSYSDKVKGLKEQIKNLEDQIESGDVKLDGIPAGKNYFGEEQEAKDVSPEEAMDRAKRELQGLQDTLSTLEINGPPNAYSEGGGEDSTVTPPSSSPETSAWGNLDDHPEGTRLEIPKDGEEYNQSGWRRSSQVTNTRPVYSSPEELKDMLAEEETDDYSLLHRPEQFDQFVNKPLRIVDHRGLPYKNSLGYTGSVDVNELLHDTEGDTSTHSASTALKAIDAWLEEIPSESVTGKFLTPIWKEYGKGDNATKMFDLAEVIHQFVYEEMAANPATSPNSFLAYFTLYSSENDVNNIAEMVDFLGQFSPATQDNYRLQDNMGDNAKFTIDDVERNDPAYGELSGQRKATEGNQRERLQAAWLKTNETWTSKDVEWRRFATRGWFKRKADLINSLTDAQYDSFMKMVGMYIPEDGEEYNPEDGYLGKGRTTPYRDLDYALLYHGLGFNDRAGRYENGKKVVDSLLDFYQKPGAIDRLLDGNHINKNYITPELAKRLDTVRAFRDGLSKRDKERWDSLSSRSDERFLGRRAEWFKQVLTHPEGPIGAMKRVYASYSFLRDRTSTYNQPISEKKANIEAREELDKLKARMPLEGLDKKDTSLEVGLSSPKTGRELTDKMLDTLASIVGDSKYVGVDRIRPLLEGKGFMGKAAEANNSFTSKRLDILNLESTMSDTDESRAKIDDELRALYEMADADLRSMYHTLQFDLSQRTQKSRAADWGEDGLMAGIPEEYQLFQGQKAMEDFAATYQAGTEATRSTLRDHIMSGDITDSTKFMDSVRGKFSTELEGYDEEILKRITEALAGEFDVYYVGDPLKSSIAIGKNEDGSVIYKDTNFDEAVIASLANVTLPNPSIYADAQERGENPAFVTQYSDWDASLIGALSNFGGSDEAERVQTESLGAFMSALNKLTPESRDMVIQDMIAVLEDGKFPNPIPYHQATGLATPEFRDINKPDESNQPQTQIVGFVVGSIDHSFGSKWEDNRKRGHAIRVIDNAILHTPGTTNNNTLYKRLRNFESSLVKGGEFVPTQSKQIADASAAKDRSKLEEQIARHPISQSDQFPPISERITEDLHSLIHRPQGLKVGSETHFIDDVLKSNPDKYNNPEDYVKHFLDDKLKELHPDQNTGDIPMSGSDPSTLDNVSSPTPTPNPTPSSTEGIDIANNGN